MKLKYFSEQTLPKQTPGAGKKVARVSFQKSGVIQFNPQACALIGIKEGSRITLAQEEAAPENWYFFIDKEHGFELRSGYKGHGAQFNHSTMVNNFLEANKLEGDKTHSFLIAGKPTEIPGDKSKTKYWGVLIPT